MVKDITSGSAGSFSYTPAVKPVVMNNELYFNANDGNNGYELWKSDGTASGTVMVKDINIGGSDSFPQHLTVVGNTLYFDANDGTNGNELWKSDGTASGTVMVKDIAPIGTSASSLNTSQVSATPSISKPPTEPTESNCGRAMEQPQAR